MRLDSHLPATLRAVFSIVLFWPWLLAPSPATARETSIPEVNVAVTGNLGDLARHVEFLEDAQGQLDIDAVMTQPSERWQRTGEFNLQLGFSTSARWVRVRFGNSGEVPVRRILEVDWPLLNFLDVTVLSGGQPVQSYQVGDQRPFAQRPIPARTFLFPLEVPPHSEQTVVMRLAMQHGIFNAVPLHLWDDADLINAVQTENGILGLYFGAIVSLLGYNLLLFASTRTPWIFVLWSLSGHARSVVCRLSWLGIPVSLAGQRLGQSADESCDAGPGASDGHCLCHAVSRDPSPRSADGSVAVASDRTVGFAGGYGAGGSVGV